MSVSPAVVAVNALLIVTASLVVAQCFRGYVRNGSRPLAFLGLGIALLAVLPTTLFVLDASLPVTLSYYDVFVLAQVLGLLSVLYALTRA
ncbi:hypothetical protein [Salinirubrum litoreum]|uniref:Uncharacterized protein n=1 Tax=Salinirubrum litoreum TaxID=1126234 RepID=A0ABD5RB67_9EURY|nr:hypothetical protein [Salinirubrum litoreum]